MYVGEVEWDLYILLPDGNKEKIKQKIAHTAVETLVVWVCPTSSDNNQLKKIFEKGKEQTNHTTNGHLPAKYTWVLYRLKLWLVLCYGLAMMATPFNVADKLQRELE